MAKLVCLCLLALLLLALVVDAHVSRSRGDDGDDDNVEVEAVEQEVESEEDDTPPVHCKLSDWSPCSAQCGPSGKRVRTVVVEPKNDGTACGALTEACNTHLICPPEELVMLRAMVLQKQAAAKAAAATAAPAAAAAAAASKSSSGKASSGKKGGKKLELTATKDKKKDDKKKDDKKAAAPADPFVVALASIDAAIKSNEAITTAEAKLKVVIAARAVFLKAEVSTKLAGKSVPETLQAKALELETSLFTKMISFQKTIIKLKEEAKAQDAELDKLTKKAFKNLLPSIAIQKLKKGSPVKVAAAASLAYIAANQATEKVLAVADPAMMAADMALTAAQVGYYKVALSKGEKSSEAKSYLKKWKAAKKTVKTVEKPFKKVAAKVNKLARTRDLAFQTFATQLKAKAASKLLELALKLHPKVVDKVVSKMGGAAGKIAAAAASKKGGKKLELAMHKDSKKGSSSSSSKSSGKAASPQTPTMASHNTLALDAQTAQVQSKLAYAKMFAAAVKACKAVNVMLPKPTIALQLQQMTAQRAKIAADPQVKELEAAVLEATAAAAVKKAAGVPAKSSKSSKSSAKSSEASKAPAKSSKSSKGGKKLEVAALKDKKDKGTKGDQEKENDSPLAEALEAAQPHRDALRDLDAAIKLADQAESRRKVHESSLAAREAVLLTANAKVAALERAAFAVVLKTGRAYLLDKEEKKAKKKELQLAIKKCFKKLPSKMVKKLEKAPAIAVILPATLADTMAQTAAESVHKVSDKIFDTAESALRKAELQYDQVVWVEGEDSPVAKQMKQVLKKAAKALKKAKKPLDKVDKLIDNIARVKDTATELVETMPVSLKREFAFKLASKVHAKLATSLGPALKQATGAVLAQQNSWVLAEAETKEAIAVAQASVANFLAAPEDRDTAAADGVKLPPAKPKGDEDEDEDEKDDKKSSSKDDKKSSSSSKSGGKKK